MTVAVTSPCPGVTLPLQAVPDPVFSGQILGPGIALIPHGPNIFAPVGGEAIKVMPHAAVIKVGKKAVLVHLGLDTVSADKKAFHPLIQKGETVSQGQQIFTWDPEKIAQAGMSNLVVVIYLEGEVTSLKPGEMTVETGDKLFDIPA